MKQKEKINLEIPRIFPQFLKRVERPPVLLLGHPKVDEDDDEDDLDLSSLLSRKTPFSIIANSLYNVDYNNRIIVIDEQIDQRCFVYAKMIENWNREDKEALILKDEFNKLVEENPELSIFFKPVDVGPNEAEELQKRCSMLVDKHPNLKSLFFRLQEVGISQAKILDYQPTPIKIKFNSPGGWLVAYQTLADVIILSKTKVIGINMGMAYSAAAFLLVSCHERLALPKSRMMVHRGSGGNYGSFEQTESSQKNYKDEVDEMVASFRKRTKIPSKVLKDKMNPDWYLSAGQALKYGLIDRIVSSIDEIIGSSKQRTECSPLLFKSKKIGFQNNMQIPSVSLYSFS